MSYSSVKQYFNYAAPMLASVILVLSLITAPFISTGSAEASQAKWISAQKCVEIYAKNAEAAHKCVNENSVEAMVYRAYKVTFSRTPDQGGHKYWVGVGNTAVKNGKDPVTAVITGMMKSSEYGNEIMTENTLLWVKELYQRSFNRYGGTPEIEYWADQINHKGKSHNYVLRFFTQSPEAKKLHSIPAVCYSVDSDLVCHY